MKQKIEYLISILISLALMEFGSFCAWSWYWSGFEWSPLGYETCGLEILVFAFFVWPAFILGELIRIGLLARWKFPAYVWYLPLLLCGSAATAICKSLTIGIFCIIVMLILPVIDFLGFRKAERKTKINKKTDKPKGWMFFVLCFAVLCMAGCSNQKRGETFYDTEWVRFLGRKDSKQWISHKAVDNAAQKILNLKHSVTAKTSKKEMFPFSILFISSDGKERVVWLNVNYFSFDKKEYFSHDLTGEEMENFYRAVHAPQKISQ